MNLKRSEFAKGFQFLGFVGLLVGAVVIPSQWVTGDVRFEATAGVLTSGVFVFLAVLLSKSLRPIWVVVAQLSLYVGVIYLVAFLSAASEAVENNSVRVCAFALASGILAFVGGYALRRIDRVGVQLAVQPEGPSSRPSA